MMTMVIMIDTKISMTLDYSILSMNLNSSSSSSLLTLDFRS